MKAYISAVTDPKTISIVGTVPVLANLQTYARGQGLLVQEMFIRGKVHNPENACLVKDLCDLCDRTPQFQLPDARSLQAVVRSNTTGSALSEGPLTHEVVRVILASRCEWYTLLTEVAKDLDLSGRRSHLFATFGIGDCTPLSPFHKLQLQITKLDVVSFNRDNSSTKQDNSLGSEYTFPSDAIAIVGASCRLPGANNLEELWHLISSGKSRHEEVPTDRFNIHESFRASQDWKFAGKRKFYGNFIDGPGNYDHAFFRATRKRQSIWIHSKGSFLNSPTKPWNRVGISAHTSESREMLLDVSLAPALLSIWTTRMPTLRLRTRQPEQSEHFSVAE